MRVIGRKRIAFYCAAAVSAPFLVSCAGFGGGGLIETVDEARQEAEDLLATAAPEAPSRSLVTVHDGPWLADTRIAHSGAPWLHEQVEIRAAGLPFDLCLAKAVEQLNASPSVVFAANLVDRERVVTLDHDGSFRDFLNLLAEASGFGWEETAGALHWMAEVSRTFEIHRVPGNIAYTMSTVKSDDQQIVRTGGGGGGSSTGVRATPEAGGNIILQSAGGFWDTLDETLRRLIDDPGNPPIIDRTTGTVVVRGPAGRVREAGRHIDALNAWLARQVLLEIQLVTVKMSADRVMGIDWKVVGQKAGSFNPAISSTFTEAAQRATGATLGTFGFAIDPGAKEPTEPEFDRAHPTDSHDGVRHDGARHDGDDNPALAWRLPDHSKRALSSQGETSVRNAPRLVAMNGQAAQLQVLSDRGVLAGVDVITREAASLATEVRLEAGVVSTGMSLTLLPKIVGNRIFLQANILVSELVALTTAGGGDQSIQLPTVDRSQFFQSVRLNSGETLALSGLTSDRGGKGREGIVNFSWLGTRDQMHSRLETVLLITPTLLDQPAPDEELLL